MELITQLPDRLISGVYFLKFSGTLGNLDNTRGQARYYVGWAHDVRRRLEDHRRGEGAKITAAAVQRGMALELVAVLVGGAPEDEKRIKARKNTRLWLEAHLPKPAAPVVEDDDDRPDYTAREVYDMAYRAARSAAAKTTLKEKTRQRQLLDDLREHFPRAVAAASASAAALRVAAQDTGERFAQYRAKKYGAMEKRALHTVMVRGDALRVGDVFRFSSDPATWFTITSRGGGYSIRLAGVHGDGTAALHFISGLKFYPIVTLANWCVAPRAGALTPGDWLDWNRVIPGSTLIAYSVNGRGYPVQCERYTFSHARSGTGFVVGEHGAQLVRTGFDYLVIPPAAPRAIPDAERRAAARTDRLMAVEQLDGWQVAEQTDAPFYGVGTPIAVSTWSSL